MYEWLFITRVRTYFWTNGTTMFDTNIVALTKDHLSLLPSLYLYLSLSSRSIILFPFQLPTLTVTSSTLRMFDDRKIVPLRVLILSACFQKIMTFRINVSIRASSTYHRDVSKLVNNDKIFYSFIAFSLRCECVFPLKIIPRNRTLC